MALDRGWFGAWYQDGYFPPVWFAPADESAVPPEELKPTGGGKARARLAYPAAVLRPRPFRPAQPTVDMAALRRAEEDALLLTACL